MNLYGELRETALALALNQIDEEDITGFEYMRYTCRECEAWGLDYYTEIPHDKDCSVGRVVAAVRRFGSLAKAAR